MDCNQNKWTLKVVAGFRHLITLKEQIKILNHARIGLIILSRDRTNLQIVSQAQAIQYSTANCNRQRIYVKFMKKH